MAAKTTLNAKNLEALGAERLAELLLEVSAGNAAAKRRLRLALAGAQSPNEVAREVRKRLTTIGRSRSFVDWQGIRLLADDLDTQRRAIVETVAKAEPGEALDLLWRLMALAPSVFERCDDSSGVVSGVFRQACRDLGEVASRAGADPINLADRTFEALTGNDYGQFDELIRVLAPALGQPGLEHLKQRMIDLSNRPVKKPAEKDRVKIGWSSAGPIYEDEIEEQSRLSTVRWALTEIADAQGDVDAFIAQHERESAKSTEDRGGNRPPPPCGRTGPGGMAGDRGGRTSSARQRLGLARLRMGRCPDRGTRSARAPRRCPSRALELLRALAVVLPSPGLSEAAARFRRCDGRAKGARSRADGRAICSRLCHF